MIILVLLITIIQAKLIFPNQPNQWREIKWIQCAPPNSPYKFSPDNNLPQYYLIDDKAICENNTDGYDITQNNFGQLWYYFVFAKHIENELIISIDGIRYYIDVSKLNKKNEVVILHTHEKLEGNRFPISIQGMNNQFQQLYIFLLSNETKASDLIIYNEIQYPIENEILQNLKLLNFESNILEQKYIFIAFTFRLQKLQSLLCQFNILGQDNVSLHSYNDSIIQLTSKSKIQNRLSDFILRVQSSVQIKQIFAGNFSYTFPLDILLQIDKENNLIRTFINESNEKLTLSSEMQIQIYPQNSTVIIEIKPQNMECPQNSKIQITHLQITNINYVQQTQFIQNYDCQIQIPHQFIDDGLYQVKLSAKMQIQDLNFYLENSGSFTINNNQSVEFYLGIVIGVFLGTTIFFICIFIVVLKNCAMKIYGKWDRIYYQAIFVEKDVQSLE